jgi:hypothetical protein
MDPNTAVVSTLDGVTTVLVAFLFVCLIFPSIVKHRSQYYAAMMAIIIVIALHALALMFRQSVALVVAAAVFTAVLQIIALLLLVLSVGGLTVRQLAGDMARAYEVMRRGETKKEVIIPIGEQAGRRERSEEGQSNVYHIDTGSTPGKSEGDKGIPLE